MANPKGMRTKSFKLNDTDAVFVYSEPKHIWLQLRRDHPTQKDIGVSSFKTALRLSRAQALELAGELLTAASQQQDESSSGAGALGTPANHGKQWDEKEEKQLLSRYSSNMSLEDIAKKHQRGIGGVRSRLVKLGRIDPEQQA